MSDLDGTLLGPDKRISPANVTAVRALRDRGLLFALGSGRRHQNSLRYYEELALDGPLISCAGALVKDPSTGETLREVPLPAPLAAEIVREGEAAGFSVVYYHRDHLFVARRDHWIELYESRVQERAEICDLSSLDGAAALKVVWYGDPTQIARCRPAAQAHYAGQATIVMTDAENLEFLAPAANKAEAMACLASFYDVAQCATVAFGDGENDVPMLTWAALGIAMDRGPARDKCPRALITPPGPPEDSFARAAQVLLARIN